MVEAAILELCIAMNVAFPQYPTCIAITCNYLDPNALYLYLRSYRSYRGASQSIPIPRGNVRHWHIKTAWMGFRDLQTYTTMSWKPPKSEASSFLASNLFDVAGKVVLVTGGSRGIGKAVRSSKLYRSRWSA